MNSQAFLSGYLNKEEPATEIPKAKPVKKVKPREDQMLSLTKKLRKKAI